MPPCCHQSGARTRWKVRTSSSTCGTQIPIAARVRETEGDETAEDEQQPIAPQGRRAARQSIPLREPRLSENGEQAETGKACRAPPRW